MMTLASYPGHVERWPGIHCLRMRGSPGFLGNLDTTAILVRVIVGVARLNAARFTPVAMVFAIGSSSILSCLPLSGLKSQNRD